MQFGKDNDQMSVFNLQTFNETKLGGSGGLGFHKAYGLQPITEV